MRPESRTSPIKPTNFSREMSSCSLCIDFCCYSVQQRKTIVSVIQSYKWAPMNITYSAFGCNVDHDGKTVYIHAQPDQKGQNSLLSLVQGIEKAIQMAGVPIPNPRVQAFHSTLARVSPQFPSDQLVQAMTGKNFGTVDINWFLMEPYIHVFNATQM